MSICGRRKANLRRNPKKQTKVHLSTQCTHCATCPLLNRSLHIELAIADVNSLLCFLLFLIESHSDRIMTLSGIRNPSKHTKCIKLVHFSLKKFSLSRFARDSFVFASKVSLLRVNVDHMNCLPLLISILKSEMTRWQECLPPSLSEFSPMNTQG